MFYQQNFLYTPALILCPIDSSISAIILYYYVGVTSLAGFVICFSMVIFQIWVSGYFKYFKLIRLYLYVNPKVYLN